LEGNPDLDAVEKIFLYGDGAPPQEGTGNHLQGHILPASTWRRKSREPVLNLMPEGNSGKLSKRVPGITWKPSSERGSPRRSVREKDGN